MGNGNPPLTANDIRAIAETFDGLRDCFAYLVEDATTPTGVKIIPSPPNPPPPNFVLVCYTKTTVPGRLCPTSVTIAIPNETAQEVSQPHGAVPAFDSLFWSESSWEKFLRPYYARFHEPDDFVAMWNDMTKSFVVALAHDPKSEYTLLPNSEPPTPGVLYTDRAGKLRIAANYAQFKEYLVTL
jgi:hypothetical protein